ncbi:MAG: peptidoglycan DD-metalloendopeptidase family protein [Flavobacteriales bacterium]|jgi:septal ring factor EnvC (AmiA/AmiB activator)|nr:peptidoglycan DD-metalloendopeptidase family protein [Flavobacteriales bacterium]
MKRLSYKLLTLVLAILLNSSWAIGQNKQSLKNELQSIQKELTRINKQLKENKKERRSFEQNLKLIKDKVGYRKKLINTIVKELSVLEYQIKTKEKNIKTSKQSLDVLKKDFATTLQSLQKQSKNSNNWVFIFNSKNLQDAYKRYYYLKQYGDYRKNQKKALIEEQNKLQQKILVLNKKVNEKEALKEKNQQAKQELVSDQKELNKLLSKNKKQEQDLYAQYLKKKKQRDSLNKKIREIIAAERAKRKKKPKKSGKKAVDYLDLPETKLVSSRFEKNKGILPWPVSKGRIKNRFGKHRHPTLPNIFQTFNGIEISTNEKESVKSVFGGKVSSVIVLPNGTKGVIIRHGKYVTIYANLKDTSVKRGQKVKARQIIGSVFGTKAQEAVLNFQIWKENKKGETKVNPEHWLKKK